VSKVLDIYTDGACSGNPGPAAIGVVIKENGKTTGEISQEIGEATNNIAEYMAVIYGLQEALIRRADHIKIHMDSELVYYQLSGKYKVKNANLKVLFAQIQHLSKGFKKIELRRIPRLENQEADKLASQKIKKEQAKVVASLFCTGEESPSSRG